MANWVRFAEIQFSVGARELVRFGSIQLAVPRHYAYDARTGGDE
jgi:hypothetical protein